MSRNLIIAASIGTYMVICVVVGLWAMRRTKTSRDFFVAGRQLGLVVTGVAMFASTMSGFGFVGGPGLVYSMGVASIWIIVPTAIGFATSDFLVGKRLRLFAGAFDTVSLPDAVAVRYGSETVRLLTAVAILLGILGYLATQILAMATVLQSVLGQMGWFGEVTITACVVVSTSVLVFYCVTGGIIASVYTDLIQGTVMIVAGILVFLTALATVEGGVSGAVASLLADDPESVGPWGTLGIVGCLSWYFMFSIGTAGQPHLLTKVMMTKSVEEYRWVPILNVTGFMITALLWVTIGLVMRALVVQGRHPELASPDAAAPEFLQFYAFPLLAGIVFAALFAAIMSTADAFLNIGAAALIHDIPKALGGRAPRRELMWARIATALLAVVGAVFALYSHYVNARLVALLGAFGWGTFGAALVPAVAIGLNWKRATPQAASIAIVASLIVNFSVELFNVSLPHGLHGGTVALLLSLVLFFGISLAQRPPELDPDVAELMDI